VMTYNGHRSWNAWNVALWIGNDEELYTLAMTCINHPAINHNRRGFNNAARVLRRVLGDKTPDGARYNQLSVRLALEGLAE
jgi:hypothetical protein